MSDDREEYISDNDVQSSPIHNPVKGACVSPANTNPNAISGLRFIDMPDLSLDIPIPSFTNNDDVIEEWMEEMNENTFQLTASPTPTRKRKQMNKSPIVLRPFSNPYATEMCVRILNNRFNQGIRKSQTKSSTNQVFVRSEKQ